MTQLARVELGKDIEQTHMRNRKMISEWPELGAQGECHRKGSQRQEDLYRRQRLRQAAYLLRKDAPRSAAHQVGGRFRGGRDRWNGTASRWTANCTKRCSNATANSVSSLTAASVNPIYTPVMEGGEIVDIIYEYPKSYTEQMLDYSSRYFFLPW